MLGQLPLEVGIVGDGLAVAALRGEVGRDPPRGRRRRASGSGSGRSSEASISSSALLVGPEQRRAPRPASSSCAVVGRCLDVGGADDQLGGVRLRGQQRLGQQVGIEQPVGHRTGRVVAVRGHAVRRSRGPGGRGGRAAGASVALRLSVERRTARPVPTTPAPVTRTRPASVAPVTRMSPARNRNTARMSAPSGREQVRADPELGLADHAAAALEGRRVPELRRRAPRRARCPSVPAASMQRQRRHQAQQRRCAADASGGRQLAHEDEAAGHHQGDGHGVAEGAEDEAGGRGRRRRRAPPRPSARRPPRPGRSPPRSGPAPRMST